MKSTVEKEQKAFGECPAHFICFVEAHEEMQADRKDFDPPIFISSFFPTDEDDDEEYVKGLAELEEEERNQKPEKEFAYLDESLLIREFSYSTTNGSYVWPNSAELAKFIMEHITSFKNKRILELGSGTGILGIYLRKKGLELVTSDYADEAISDNIKYNCDLNGVTYCHIPHTWGTPFPFEVLDASFASMTLSGEDQSVNKTYPLDIVIASDILIYVEQYENLTKTLVGLFNDTLKKREALGEVKGGETFEWNGQTYAYPFFLLNVARRLKMKTLFFELLEKAGFIVEPVAKTLYFIHSYTPKPTSEQINSEL